MKFVFVCLLVVGAVTASRERRGLLAGWPLGLSTHGSIAVGPSHHGSIAVGPSHHGSIAVGPSHHGSIVVGPSHDGAIAVGPSHTGAVMVGPSHDGAIAVGPSSHGAVYTTHPIAAPAIIAPVAPLAIGAPWLGYHGGLGLHGLHL